MNIYLLDEVSELLADKNTGAGIYNCTNPIRFYSKNNRLYFKLWNTNTDSGHEVETGEVLEVEVWNYIVLSIKMSNNSDSNVSIWMNNIELL